MSKGLTIALMAAAFLAVLLFANAAGQYHLIKDSAFEAVLSGQSSKMEAEIQCADGQCAKRKDHHTKPSVAAPLPTSSEVVESEIARPVGSDNKSATSQEAKQKRRDLDAQESMALWAMIMALTSIVTAIITGYGIFLLRRTLGETARAADHAETMADEARKATVVAQATAAETRRIGEIQARACLVISKVWASIPIDHRESRRPLHIVCNVKNCGPTPARGIEVFFETLSRNPDSVIDDYEPMGSLNLGEEDAFDFPWSDIKVSGRYVSSAAVNRDGRQITLALKMNIWYDTVFGPYTLFCRARLPTQEVGELVIVHESERAGRWHLNGSKCTEEEYHSHEHLRKGPLRLREPQPPHHAPPDRRR